MDSPVNGIYRHEFTVPPAAVDGNGHVNNVEYVRWMQDTAVAHSTGVGCTRATQEIGATWVARSHHIEYLRPAFAGDRILALTWVCNFRKVRSTRKYKFLRRSDNAILAEGETDWVFVDAATGRPRSIPETIASLFILVPPEDEP